MCVCNGLGFKFLVLGYFLFVAQTTSIFQDPAAQQQKTIQGRPWHAFACLPASTRSTCCCPCCPEHEPSTLVPSTAGCTGSGHSMDLAGNWDFKQGHDLHTCPPWAPSIHSQFGILCSFVVVFIGGLGRWLLLKSPGKKIETSSKHHFWVSCLGSLTYFC